MSDPALFQLEGSQPKSAVHYVPLSIQKFFSGLWTQRSPFNGPDNRYNTRFLGGRPDMLLDGLNMELTNYGTIIRRPGTTLFSTAILSSPALTFYSFHDLTGAIRVMADTATNVSVLTSISNTNIFTKSVNSGQTYFQGIGNTLYFGDGVDLQAWNPSISNTVRNWGISIGSVASAPANYAGTGADGGGPHPWTSPTNIQGAPDNNNAVVTLTTDSSGDTILANPLNATNYSFAIGSLNTIQGIQVTLTALQSVTIGTNQAQCSFQLLLNGAPIGNQKFADIPLSSGTVVLGSSSDTWGAGLTPSNINGSTFGIQMIPRAGRETAPFTQVSAAQFFNAVQIQVFSSGGPVVALVAGTLTATTGYQYVFAYGNSNGGTISNPTPPSAVIKPTAQGIQISLVASTDPQVNQIHVYRTKDGGSVYYELPTSPYPNTTGNVTDNATDASLQQLVFWPTIPTFSNTPPPAGLVKYTYHLGRIWGAVGNFVYYSGGPDTLLGSGNEAFPPANSFLFPSQVNRLVPISSGLLVFTTDDVFIILGTNTATFYAMPFQQGVGLLSWNALDIQGSNIFLFTSDKQFLQFSSSGINEVGYAIGDLLNGSPISGAPVSPDDVFNPGSVYVASLIAGTFDKAVFIADGTDDWYRCNWNQPPEGGPAWSPKARITGGASSVVSLETSPGIHQLLIGRPDGSVVFRDVTSYSDAGNPYTAFVVFGSMVLAQPGQLAEVVSVTTEHRNTGTQPGVSVLLEEINGNFEPLPNGVPDPPGLIPSNSVLAQRFYLNQAQQTVDCRHLQAQLTYAPEAFKSELLTFAIFGRLKYKE